MEFKNTIDFALELDANDELKKYKNEFVFPQKNSRDVIYFTGNSLGLQSKRAIQYVNEVMQDWGDLGVDGHFEGNKPWWDYHERFNQPLSKIVGAKESEVTVMNTLTVNLHIMLASFYRPTTKRYKILCEEKSFPSDQYLVQTQAQLHGFHPKDVIVEVRRREGEHNFRTEDILQKIEEIGDELALVLIGGVNYYTGQLFDIKAITAQAHQFGAYVGWDLAHAVGNVELDLHQWQVDFACWCSYKYMNAGPGSASGCFIHEKHHLNKDLVRLGGWWGHNKERRFLMEPKFDPIQSAHGWQISNPSILSLAPYLASVELFDEVGMDKLSAKSILLTNYLMYIIKEVVSEVGGLFEVITPLDEKQRGCQISILLHGKGRDVFNQLTENGVIIDWREPNVIRLAPVPFYTSFEDIFNFGQLFKNAVSI